MIADFADWLVNTPLSHLIADHIWVVALTQTIHIICVALIMIAAVTLNIRVLGLAGSSQSLLRIATHSVPWIWVSLVVLLLTGIILTLAEPARELLNWTFRIKIVLIVIVAVITNHYAATLRKDEHYWDAAGPNRTLALALGSISLFFWVGILVCGRLIAYVGAA